RNSSWHRPPPAGEPQSQVPSQQKIQDSSRRGGQQESKTVPVRSQETCPQLGKGQRAGRSTEQERMTFRRKDTRSTLARLAQAVRRLPPCWATSRHEDGLRSAGKAIRLPGVPRRLGSGRLRK